MSKVNVYFDNIESIIIKELASAHKKVRIAVAWINFNRYSRVFSELLERQIELQIIITDDLLNHRYSILIEELISKGAKIKKIRMPRKKNFMHHKFCLIDKSTLLTGSFNWTANAKLNFENLVVVKDIERVEAEKMIDEFNILSKMTPNKILKLQGMNKCEHDSCKGRVTNILVYEPMHDKYGSMRSYIYEVCTEEIRHNHMIMEDVDTSNLYYEMNGLIESYETQFEELKEYPIEQNILSEELDYKLSKCVSNKKILKDHIIHAVGFKYQKIIDRDGETEDTLEILWKNRFFPLDEIYFEHLFVEM